MPEEEEADEVRRIRKGRRVLFHILSKKTNHQKVPFSVCVNHTPLYVISGVHVDVRVCVCVCVCQKILLLLAAPPPFSSNQNLLLPNPHPPPTSCNRALRVYDSE